MILTLGIQNYLNSIKLSTSSSIIYIIEFY